VDLEAFTAAVERELQLRHAAFELKDLIAFLEEQRRNVEDNPDVELWVLAFLKRCRVEEAFRGAVEDGVPPYAHFLGREG
jgi:hypothetical protein